MALGVYVGAGSVKTVSDIYVGVNNSPRKVKEIYVGVNGTPRKCWPPYTDYGDNINLFSYGNGVALYKSDGDIENIGENNANGIVLQNQCEIDTRYTISYNVTGNCFYFTTKDKFDLRAYQYVSVQFDYTDMSRRLNASHRISVGENIKVGPQTDYLRNTTGADNMSNYEYLKILIDLRDITEDTKYYIKSGIYISLADGTYNVKLNRFQLHKSKPSNFTADFTLKPV